MYRNPHIASRIYGFKPRPRSSARPALRCRRPKTCGSSVEGGNGMGKSFELIENELGLAGTKDNELGLVSTFSTIYNIVS